MGNEVGEVVWKQLTQGLFSTGKNWGFDSQWCEEPRDGSA